MFVTLTSGSSSSVTGTDSTEGIVVPSGAAAVTNTAVLINTAPAPELNIALDAWLMGPNGGFLFNCAPREVVGSVMFAQPSPYREVIRADPTGAGPVLGVIVSKPKDTVCEVIHAGPAKAFENLTPGAPYFLGPTGTVVTTPLDVTAGPYVHFVGYAVHQDTLMVSCTYSLLKRAA